MFAIDPDMKWRIAPLMERVLIVDPQLHPAQFLAGGLTAFGAASIIIETEALAAARSALTIEPTLIFTEALEDADPFALVRSIRRSPMACRQVPIIVVTTLATASATALAKTAGAHEFIRKPFARRDLARRLDHLARQPRPWVEKAAYAGPDRRFFNSGAARRRLSDRMELIGRGVSASSLYLVRGA